MIADLKLSKWVASIKAKFMEQGFLAGTYGAEIMLNKVRSEDFSLEAGLILRAVEKLDLPKRSRFVRIMGFDSQSPEVVALADIFNGYRYGVQLLIRTGKGEPMPLPDLLNMSKYFITAILHDDLLLVRANEVWYYPPKDAPVIPEITGIPDNPVLPSLYIAQEGSVERLLAFLRKEDRPWKAL